MKPIRLLLIAIASLALALVIIRSRPQKPAATQTPEPAVTTNITPAPFDTKPAPVTETNNVNLGNLPKPVSASTEAVDSAKPVIQEIQLALQTGGLTNLQAIATHLRDPELRIRQAALMALKVSDDRRIIPDMQTVADEEADPARRAEIVEVIKFLELPSLAEATEAARTNRPGTATPAR
jgi:hypothetical protein